MLAEEEMSVALHNQFIYLFTLSLILTNCKVNILKDNTSYAEL